MVALQKQSTILTAIILGPNQSFKHKLWRVKSLQPMTNVKNDMKVEIHPEYPTKHSLIYLHETFTGKCIE